MSLVLAALPSLESSDDLAGAALTVRTVYEAHWTFVWRALRALGVREADLEDQTHEVFIVVHRRLGEFEHRSKLTTWLFAIASRVASDYRRRAHIRREQALADMPEAAAPTPAAEGLAPDAALERTQSRAALDAALDALPDDQRAVFVLFELDAMPAETIAAVVGCPINTVYSRLRLARKRFAEAVARQRARGAL